MIMKNEEAVLGEMFDSVADEIAGWFVCDTGSSDSSVTYTKEYFRRRGIPGRMKHHQWKDFSWNRNLCMREGYAEMSSKCDYWIIFDADQQLVKHTPDHLWQYRFDADAYYIKERTHGVYFSNLRIIKLVEDLWEYRGALHESIYPVESALKRLRRNVILGELPPGFYSIHDNVPTRTLEDDVEILLKGLEKHPNDTRTHFYLAKAYHAIPGRLTDALYHYARRLKLDAGETKIDPKEWYFSRYSIGVVVEELYVRDILAEEHSRILRENDIINGTISSVTDIVQLYEAASAVWKHRYEPYGHIAHIYWAQENDAMNCYKFASTGLRVGSMGDSGTNVFTSEKSVHTLYWTKCLCGFHSRQYHHLIGTCRYNLDNLPLNPSMPENWEKAYMQTSEAVLEQLEKLGVTD